MAFIQDTEVELRVAQLYFGILNFHDPNACIIRWILEQGKNAINVNWKIPVHCLPDSIKLDFECTLLHVTYAEKNIGQFQLLLDHGADFTVKNEKGSTILHHVVENLKKNQEDIDKWVPLDNPFITMILSAHVQFENCNNPCDKNGLSHFHIACMANHVDATKFFLKSGVLIDQIINMDSLINPGYNSLHLTAKYNSYETAELLISNGADMHLKNATGMTPLCLFIKERLKMFDSEHELEYRESKVTIEKKKELNEKLINMLLENDTSSCEATDDMSLSNFHVACTLNKSSVTECLLDQVTNINHAVKPDAPIFPGYTGLHFAAHCSVDTVLALVKKGADMTMNDPDGVMPLDICMRWFSSQEIHSVVASVPAWNEIYFSDGKTKLVDCILAMKSPASLEEFLKNCVDVNISLPNDSPLWPGSTPLHLAVRFSERFKTEGEEAVALVKVCLEQDFNIHTQDKQGSTALHLAFRQNQQRLMGHIVQILEMGPKTIANLSDENGLTYLHISGADQIYGSCDFTRKLLPLVQRGVNSLVNMTYEGRPLATVKPGSTPLHVAIDCQNSSVIDVLVSHFYSHLETDSQGFTAIHRLLGVYYGVQDTARTLLTMRTLEECVVESIGLTHLHVASWFGLVEPVRKLLEKGSDIEAVIEGPMENENLARFAGCRPLHVAMMSESKETVKELLQWGANIFAKRPDLTSPLSMALSWGNDKIIDLFEVLLQNNDKLQKSMEEELGMTLLHIACHRADLEKVDNLLRKGVNVNARVHDDSAIWPGCTALHLLLPRFDELNWFSSLCIRDKQRDREVFHGILDSLLANGVDLFIADLRQRTPLLLLLMQYNRSFGKERDRLNLVLKHCRDFSTNHIDNSGVSFFHLACLTKNLKAVEKFLQHGRVDVNRPINYFARVYPGYTPLNLAVEHYNSSFNDDEDDDDDDGDVQRIVGLLLNHGAKVFLENSHGHISLHTVVNYRRFILVEKLLGFVNETIMNIRTIDGRTPLEILLGCPNAETQEIKLLIEHGGRMNSHNPIDGNGYIAMVFSSERDPAKIAEISQMIMESCELSKLDEMGRNAIHNTVSLYSPTFNASESVYLDFITKLIRLGCDIDHQDIFGKTALHLAVELKNAPAVSALLMSGADFNILDFNDKPAFSYLLHCGMYEEYWNGTDKHHISTFIKKLIIRAFDVYTEKLKLTRIEVSKDNDSLHSIIRNSERDVDSFVQSTFTSQLKITESVKVDQQGLSLRSFLCETGAISIYPSLTPIRRDEIAAFFEKIDVNNFPELKHMFKLQYRKAVKRFSLIDSAEESLQNLLSFPLPYVCLRMIFLYLSNSDLRNLIAASMHEKDMSMIVS